MSENCLKDFLFSIPPKEFTLLATLIGIILTEDLNVAEQNSLGNFIVTIGTAIMTVAAQQDLMQNKMIDRLKQSWNK